MLNFSCPVKSHKPYAGCCHVIGSLAICVNRKFELWVKLNPVESLHFWCLVEGGRRWWGFFSVHTFEFWFCSAGSGVATVHCAALHCTELCCDSKQFKYGSYHVVSVFLLSLCFCEDLAAPSGNHQEILLGAQSRASVGHYCHRPCVRDFVCVCKCACVHVSARASFSWLPALAGLKIKYQPFFPQHHA